MMFDGTAPADTHNHGPGRIGGMGQREDVQASLNMQDAHERRETYGRRRGEIVGVRAGWRARLAHIEALLTTTGAADGERVEVARPMYERSMGDLRSMLDEIPQIGTSQRAPIEVSPVRESER